MLAVEDLAPWDAVDPSWTTEPLSAAASPGPPRGRPVLRPVLWALAVAYLLVDVAGRWLGRALEVYVHATDAVGRACARAGRAVLHWLGPLGRLVRRAAAPVVRLLVRCWDRLSVWLLLRMFRPLGRWARAVWARCAPLVERLWTLVQRLSRVVEPLLRVLTAAVDAVEDAAGRVSTRWHRSWAPVVRRARQLRRRH